MRDKRVPRGRKRDEPGQIHRPSLLSLLPPCSLSGEVGLCGLHQWVPFVLWPCLVYVAVAQSERGDLKGKGEEGQGVCFSGRRSAGCFKLSVSFT